ncbi:uncharacterized protein [Palaemon carinicauda]|uniref:uncharacterized protein n=1 Tax=Palaemon carinicauda TaxID=392227 RepID=UPI0035B61F27
MTRNVRKLRSKQFPKLLTSLADVDVQGRYRITLGEENWLLHDSGSDDEDRVLIFAAPSSLPKLGSSKHWLADGTFETCPNIFYQIYTIHAEIHGIIHPLLFALLPGKSEEIYVKMLYALLENMEALGIETDVTEVSIDFEVATRNAFLPALGDVTVHFCFFHFCQTTWRKIQQLGLVTHYNNDTDFSLFCRKVNALAFLLIDGVPRGMQCLKQEVPENALPFIEYIDNTFVNGMQRRNGRRSKPLFSVHGWNVYELTIAGNARTINSVEAWHRRFGVLVRSHSNLYNVLDALRRAEKIVKTRISQLIVGANPKKPNTKVARREQRIYNVVADYQNRLLEDYLRSIAHNLSSF